MNTKFKIASLIVLIAAALGAVVFAVGCSKQSGNGSNASQTETLYTCGMHPQIIEHHPGNCPICGMKLTPIRQQASAAVNGKILYYRSTMKPGETSPTPAKDSMGMDMEPVYANGASAASSEIEVDPVTIQNMNIQTIAVERGPLRRVIRTVGAIDYNETALADVTTKFKGWIEKLYADATGQLVHRGEPLFAIYSPDLYSAEIEYLLTLNQGSTNEPGNATLRETAANKLKFYDISASQIAELEKTREPRKTLEIVAPADGFVTEKNAVQGQMVDAGMKLYQLADLGIVWVYAQIYEQDLPYIQLGQESLVRLASMPDREFRGRVTYVYPSVDAKTRTARVRMEFENPGYFLKPGMFVSVQITSELDPSVLLIPDSAILRSGEKNTVFVALDGGKFDPRTVTLGPQADRDRYQVISGLREGERIVTSGQFLLDSESQLREAIQKMREPKSRGETAVSPNTGTNSVVDDGSPQRAPRQSETGEGVVYVCPMPAHVSITYDHPGKCPICGMALVPVTPGDLKKLQPGGKVLYYTCPMPEHASVHEDKPGKCPICAMTLIPVMELPKPAAVSPTNSAPVDSTLPKLYTCPMPSDADVVSDKPGNCPKCGMALVPTTSVAHGKIAEDLWRKEHSSADHQH